MSPTRIWLFRIFSILLGLWSEPPLCIVRLDDGRILMAHPSKPDERAELTFLTAGPVLRDRTGTSIGYSAYQ